MPFRARDERDQEEGREHEDVPLPPRQVPVAAEDDGDHRLRKQDERHDDGQQQRPLAREKEPREVPRREGVQGHRHGGTGTKRGRDLGRRRLGREGRQPKQGCDAPDGEHHHEADAERARPPQHPSATRAREWQCGGGGEPSRDREANGRGDHEPEIGRRQQHARRGERVKAQEARARAEGERDEDQPSIAAPHGRLVREVGQRHVHGRHGEDQPEVARLVLPLQVELRTRDEQDQPQQRQDEQQQPPRGWPWWERVGARRHRSRELSGVRRPLSRPRQRQRARRAPSGSRR